MKHYISRADNSRLIKITRHFNQKEKEAGQTFNE